MTGFHHLIDNMLKSLDKKSIFLHKFLNTEKWRLIELLQ
jgi:hypothetical protein